MFGTDVFTGTDGTALTAHTPGIGGAWNLHGTAVSLVITDSNRARSNSAANGNVMYLSGGPASADYYVQADITVKSNANYAGVVGRVTPGGASGYWAIYSSTTWQILKAGSLLASYTQALTIGNTYTVKLEMIGSTIKLYVDGVERISTTDSTYAAKGKAGVIAWGAHTNTTGLHLDNLTASSIVVTANVVVCDGDSITSGIGTNTLPWPTQLDTDLDATWTVINKGVSGQTLAQMEADATTDIDGELSVEYSGRKVLVCFAGTNDIYFNADADDNATTSLARLNTYLTNRATAGWSDRIVCTILPRGGDFSSSTLPAVKTTHFNARRAAFNTSVRANYLSYATKLADVAAVGSLMGDDGDDANLTYYQDNIHPTNAGATILKDIIYGQMAIPVVGTITLTISGPSIAILGAVAQPFLSLSPVAEAVYGALQDPTLSALLVNGSGVQSDVPEAPAFPFVWFEVSEVAQFGGFGTRPGHGALPEVDLRVHVFQGNYGTIREAEAVMSRVIEVLTTDDALVVPGYTVCGRAPFYDETIPLPFEELNGVKVQELVARFRLYVEEAA